MKPAPVRPPRSTYRRRCSRVRAAPAAGPPRRTGAVSSPSAKLASAIPARGSRRREAADQRPDLQPVNRNGSGGRRSRLLPRRTPGSSGITAVPDQPAAQPPQRHRRELATPWWEGQNKPRPAPAPHARNPAPSHPRDHAAAGAGGCRTPSAVLCRQAVTRRPAHRPAAKPAGRRRRHLPADAVGNDGRSARPGEQPRPGLAVGVGPRLVVGRRGRGEARRGAHRRLRSAGAHPGARLVPGTANGVDPAEQDHPDAADGGSLVASNGRQPQHAAAVRDPEAVRASFSSHFGGVRSGRSQARHTKQGPDQE